MALRQAFLFLLLLHVGLIHSSPLDEGSISNSGVTFRQERPHLRNGLRKLRVSPDQRIPSRRISAEEDGDAQKKQLNDVQEPGRIASSRTQVRKQRYRWQTEANINSHIGDKRFNLNHQGAENFSKSENFDSKEERDNDGSNIESEKLSAKNRDIKESILKSNSKVKVKLSEHQERIIKENHGLEESLSENYEKSKDGTVEYVNHEENPERHFPENTPKERSTSSENPKINQNRNHEINVEHFVGREGGTSQVGSKLFLDIPRQSFFELSPFSEQHTALGVNNRHKKQPFEQRFSPLGPSYTLETTYEGKTPGFPIVPDDWRGEDVLREAGSETSKGQFNLRINHESNHRDIDSSSENVQTRQIGTTKHSTEEPNVVEIFEQSGTPIDTSFSSESTGSSSTSTTTSTEDWSAVRARYSFSTNQEDGISDLSHDRKEIREGGTVRGRYSYSDGYVLRTVEYIADKNGYRIISENSSPLSPEGPKVNPDGHAAVNAEVDGQGYNYVVHGYELPRRRNYYQRNIALS